MTKKERRQIGREEPSYTNGGFRAGKRKRGNSLLRKAPVTTTKVTTYYAKDEYGNTVGKIKTFKGKLPE